MQRVSLTQIRVHQSIHLVVGERVARLPELRNGDEGIEDRDEEDALGLMRHLGAVPTPEPVVAWAGY